MAYDFAKYRNEVKVLKSKLPELPNWDLSEGNGDCYIRFNDTGGMYINNDIPDIDPEEARKMARFILEVLGD